MLFLCAAIVLASEVVRASLVAASESATSSSTLADSNSISEYCESVFSQFTHTYESTRLATSLHPWYEGFGPTDSDGVLTGKVTSQSYWTDTIICKKKQYRADEDFPSYSGEFS